MALESLEVFGSCELLPGTASCFLRPIRLMGRSPIEGPDSRLCTCFASARKPRARQAPVLDPMEPCPFSRQGRFDRGQSAKPQLLGAEARDTSLQDRRGRVPCKTLQYLAVASRMVSRACRLLSCFAKAT